MIDERQQELASLYAFDLLEGTERVQFEADLAHDPELQKLVGELRSTGAKLAFAAPGAVPPPELKTRIMTSTGGRAPADAGDGNVVPFPSRSPLATVIPWAIAAACALCAAWYGSRYALARLQNTQVETARELATIALRTAEARLEANQVTASRLAADLVATENSTKQQLATADRTRADLTQKLNLAEDDRARLSAQLTMAQQAAEKARSDLVAFNGQRQRESDLARLKIALLASMLGNSPKALAVAVWDPTRQQGVFTVDQLPANASDQRYELWVIDRVPVSAGVFSVGPDGRARIEFKPTRHIQSAAKFAVSREKNDGLPAHATPGEVIMISE